MEHAGPQAYASLMIDPRQREEDERREALRTLDSLRDSDTFATSALARTARRATDHFAARDAMNDAVRPDGSVDKIELWGRRIGRGLSLIGLVVLAIYLYLTYFAK
jgi:hypothetical protein